MDQGYINQLVGGTVRYFIFVAEAIFCQIFIVLVLMRKTKKKIVKIGALLMKWEQFPYGKKCYFCGRAAKSSRRKCR